MHDPRALSEPHSPAMPNATTPAPQTSGDERETLLVGLRRMGLANDDRFVATPLAGGVSSDIFLVETSGRSFVVKRALAKLRVAADWRAPVERNRYEVEWMKEAGRAAPHAVPRILGHDEASGLFAMEYLPPDDYPIWKSELREGRADPSFAMEVGRLLAMIHAATADSEDVASRFATDRIFKPIRFEPYLEATAAKYASSNPAAHDALMSLSRETLGRKIALVHGDISPKNILCGPHGPVFLDAECAWYGDPAFDLAFCLNHLLLKCLWTPAAGVSFLDSFDALADGYLRGVTYENPDALEARAAALLPGLFLARVDGKSPVEYIVREDERDLVRGTALPLIVQPPARLADIRAAWARRLGIA